eukprot:3932217-Rhodomonas_salina.4
MFAQDLKSIASDIPPGDPRIGELYGAATRAFGQPSFVCDPRSAGQLSAKPTQQQEQERCQSEDSDDEACVAASPNECSE